MSFRYVKLYLLPDRSKSGKRKTKVKRHTLNPVFNELHRFPVSQMDACRRALLLSVWHSDMFGRNDFLGETRVILAANLHADAPARPQWFPLTRRVLVPL